MWKLLIFLIILLIALLLYYQKNKQLKFLENINTYFSQRKYIEIDERQKLVKKLEENIGNVITIQSDDFIYVHKNQIREDHRKLTGKILEVDDEWINLEYKSSVFTKKERLDQLVFRIDSIDYFFIHTDSNEL